MRFSKARGPSEFRQVASGSATQGLWPGDRKARSQVVGVDQSRLLGRRTVGKVRKGVRRASDRTAEGVD